MVEAAGIDLLNLLVILTVAWIFGLPAERIGYRTLMGEILAGIVFGPALLGIAQSNETVDILAELGVFLLMLYVGMEVDLYDPFELGPQSLMVAFGGFVVPFGWALIRDVTGATVEQALFIGIAMAATSLATKSRILVDLEILDTRIAGVLLGGALLSDVGVMVFFAGVVGFVETGDVTFLGLAAVAGRRCCSSSRRSSVATGRSPTCGSAWSPGWSATSSSRRPPRSRSRSSRWPSRTSRRSSYLHVIIGGFMAGLFLRQTQLDPDINERMYGVIYDLAMGFFAPIFFVSVAFDLTLSVFTQDLVLLSLIVGVAFVSKIFGGWLFGVPTKLSSREALVVDLGMNGRGTVEIVIVSIALSAGVIGEALFPVLVFTAIFTTVLVPPTVEWGVDWLEEHDDLVITPNDGEMPG